MHRVFSCLFKDRYVLMLLHSYCNLDPRFPGFKNHWAEPSYLQLFYMGFIAKKKKTFPYRAECTLYIPEPLINLNENCKRGVGLLLFKASEAYTKGEFRRPLARVLLKYNGTFLQQLECGYGFPALIHVWIASAGVLEWFISTSGEATSASKAYTKGEFWKTIG